MACGSPVKDRTKDSTEDAPIISMTMAVITAVSTSISVSYTHLDVYKRQAQTWLDAVGTENEAAATKTYIAELEADIMPVDGLIGFAESEMGAQAVSYTHLDVYKRQLSHRASERALHLKS